MAKVCDDGVLRYKSIDNLSEDYPIVEQNTGKGKDCSWQDRIFCDGDIIEDPDHWWLYFKCSRGRMFRSTESWMEIADSINTSKNERQERKVIDTLVDEIGKNKVNEGPTVKITINSNSSGSQVLVNIVNEDKTLEKEKKLNGVNFVKEIGHVNQKLLKEVRDLLISRHMGTAMIAEPENSETRTNLPFFTSYVRSGSSDSLARREGSTLAGEIAADYRGRNASWTIPEQDSRKQMRLNHILIKALDRKRNSLPDRRKVIAFIRRLRNLQEKKRQRNLSKADDKLSTFKVLGLPVLQNLKNETKKVFKPALNKSLRP